MMYLPIVQCLENKTLLIACLHVKFRKTSFINYLPAQCTPQTTQTAYLLSQSGLRRPIS